MRKAEQKVWDAMRRAAPPKAWLQRVENLVADGMPDVYCAGGRREAWVELKAAKLPKRSTTRLQMGEGIRQSQVNWHLKAATKGVQSFILIRVEERKSEPLLIGGWLADRINDFTYDEARGAALAIGWPAIFALLLETDP